MLSAPGLDQQAVLLASGPAEIALRPEPAGVWLILNHADGLGSQLAERLAGRQQQFLLAEPGDDYRALGEGRYELPVEDRQAWRRLLSEALPAEPPLRGVVHLASLRSADTGATTAASLMTDIRHD